MKFRKIIKSLLITTVSFSQLTLASDLGGEGGGRGTGVAVPTRSFRFSVVSHNLAGPQNSVFEYANSENANLNEAVIRKWREFSSLTVGEFIEGNANRVFAQSRVFASEAEEFGFYALQIADNPITGTMPIQYLKVLVERLKAKASAENPRRSLQELTTRVLASAELRSLTVGDIFFLAAASPLRIIGAADRAERPVATKKTGTVARLSPWQIPLDGYLASLEANLPSKGMKYGDPKSIADNFAKGFKVPRDLYDEGFLTRVDTRRFTLELITTLHGNPEGRLLQLVVYDMINALAFQEVGKDFSELFEHFNVMRGKQIKGMIESYIDGAHIVCLQEAQTHFLPEGIEGTVSFEEDEGKVSSGQSSAIVIPENKGLLFERNVSSEIESLKGIEGCDFVANKLVRGNQTILVLSIHTPSKGAATLEIVDKVREFFASQEEFHHLIIAMDANTKTTDLRGQLFDSAKAGELPLSFAYFPRSTKDEFLRLTGRAFDETSQGMRTFVQSQLGKAMKSEGAYVDFILHTSKPTATMELKSQMNLEFDPQSGSGVMNDHNWSDHLPRGADFILKYRRAS